MARLYDTMIDYFKGSYQELGRVLWPSAQTTARLTLIVIGVSLFVAIVLGAFDALFRYLGSLLILNR